METDIEAQNKRPPMLKEAHQPDETRRGHRRHPSRKHLLAHPAACPSTPIPAVTFRQSTHEISQNCGVLSA
jgi:hypothetical protein